MRHKKKAAVALTFCILFICTIFLISTTLPIISTFPKSPEALSFQSKDTSIDPTIQINGIYYNLTWFQITETVIDIIEGNLTGPPGQYLKISWNDNSNRSVAMSFNTTVTTYFNGIQLWIGYNNTPPDLRVELRNGTKIGTQWVPNNETGSILLSQNYTYGNFTSGGGWATLLNDTIIELNSNWTYFILLMLNETTSGDATKYYSWGCTSDPVNGDNGDNGDNGIALLLEFSDVEEINDTSYWLNKKVDFDCWMMLNFTKLQHTLTLQLPANWTLNRLWVDVFNSTGNIGYSTSGSAEGNITAGIGSFTVNVSNGDRMYLAVITFTDIKPVSWLNIIEDTRNSDGYARTVGNMSEAQRFILPHDSENLTIQILIRNTGLTENLTAEIRNATYNSLIGAYKPSDEPVVSLEIPYQDITSNYEWLTLNFTGYFSEGNYFLVIHTKDWAGNPSSSRFYDWASHSTAYEIPPPEGYEVWTSADNHSDWNWDDVRDPYGNRYWHCMKVISYNSTDTENIDIWINNKLAGVMGNNRVWNDTVWIPILATNDYNYTFSLKCSKDITYNLSYDLYYYNYSNGLNNNIRFYVNDFAMTNSTQGYWYQSLTSSQAKYNVSTGMTTLIFKALDITSGKWTSATINASISAIMSYTENRNMTSDTLFTFIYNHQSNATISLSQESMYIDYSTVNVTAVDKVYLNSTSLLSGNWTDDTTADRITILKNAFNETPIGQEISGGEIVNVTMQFYSSVNVTPPIIPYINEEVTLNITNVLDKPASLNVTIINPNGTIRNLLGNTNDNQNWNVTFEPQEVGKYIVSVKTQSEGREIITREIGSQAVEKYYYTFNVYQLGAGLIEPDVNTNKTLTVGTPFKLLIWIRYVPYTAETPQVNVTRLEVLLNNVPTTNNATYNNNTGYWELLITSSELSQLGPLNITLNITDNADRNLEKSFTVQVVPPTLPSPISMLSPLTANAAISSINLDSMSRIITIIFVLLICSLIFMRIFYPDTLIKIHKTLLRRP
ncbi:MAG: hypothetical protein ACUVXA_00255 [Candidatus Jordarchaeum sp.]|uniref:hypothetical protein n=1 Tax=Candidatus Jordarchaeum sp. TaxID=2823881 RepID=UPI0040494CC7